MTKAKNILNEKKALMTEADQLRAAHEILSHEKDALQKQHAACQTVLDSRIKQVSQEIEVRTKVQSSLAQAKITNLSRQVKELETQLSEFKDAKFTTPRLVKPSPIATNTSLTSATTPKPTSSSRSPSPKTPKVPKSPTKLKLAPKSPKFPISDQVGEVAPPRLLVSTQKRNREGEENEAERRSPTHHRSATESPKGKRSRMENSFVTDNSAPKTIEEELEDIQPQQDVEEGLAEDSTPKNDIKGQETNAKEEAWLEEPMESISKNSTISQHNAQTPSLELKDLEDIEELPPPADISAVANESGDDKSQLNIPQVEENSTQNAEISDFLTSMESSISETKSEPAVIGSNELNNPDNQKGAEISLETEDGEMDDSLPEFVEEQDENPPKTEEPSKEIEAKPTKVIEPIKFIEFDLPGSTPASSSSTPARKPITTDPPSIASRGTTRGPVAFSRGAAKSIMAAKPPTVPTPSAPSIRGGAAAMRGILAQRAKRGIKRGITKP
jgi:hypothetical protein